MDSRICLAKSIIFFRVRGYVVGLQYVFPYGSTSQMATSRYNRDQLFLSLASRARPTPQYLSIDAIHAFMSAEQTRFGFVSWTI